MNLIEKEQMIRISTGGSRKLVNNSKEIRRKNSRKSSGQSDIDDWRIVEHKEIVKSDTSLTMFINGCRNKWYFFRFLTFFKGETCLYPQMYLILPSESTKIWAFRGKDAWKTIQML